ncbi:hypothetical protein ACFTAO_35865 [Paenibacillus rhizoplanae]
MDKKNDHLRHHRRAAGRQSGVGRRPQSTGNRHRRVVDAERRNGAGAGSGGRRD